MADLLNLHLLQPHQWKQAEQSHLLWDQKLSELAVSTCRHGSNCHETVKALTESLQIKIVFIAVIAYFCWKLSQKLKPHLRGLLLVYIAAAMALSDLVSNQLKYVFQRLRPDLGLWFLEGKYKPSYSMPSNHAFNLAALATLIAILFRAGYLKGVKFPIAVATVTLLTGISRVFIARHYPLDILAGFVLGALYGALAGFLIKKFLKKSGPTRRRQTFKPVQR